MVEGITFISIQGYKSLVKECLVGIHPLTILAGPNSSGKSSIMQPLLLMKQTLEESYDPGDLKINGPNVKYTLAERFLSKLSGKRQVESFTISIEIDGTKLITETFRKERRTGIELVDMIYKDTDQMITLHPEMIAEEIISTNPAIDESWKRVQKIFQRRERKLELRVKRSRCFLEIVAYLIKDDKEEAFPVIYPVSEAFEKKDP